MTGSFSIVKRLTVLTVAASVIAIGVIGALMFSILGPMFDELVDNQAQTVATVRGALASTAPAQRPALAKSLTRDGLHVYRTPWWTAPPLQLGTPPPLAMERLQRTLGDGVTLRTGKASDRPDQAVLQASFALDADRWFVELDLTRADGPNPLLFGATLALGCVGFAFLLAVVAGVRLITRPLARIAWQRAERQSRLRPLDITRSFGTELHPLIQSFNELVRSVQRTDEARRRMLAGISHDLRTPLARLRLRAETACAPSTADAMQPDFEAMDGIIRQFLAYAQAGSGVATGHAEPLSELVRHVESMYVDQGVRVDMRDAEVQGFLYPDVSIQRILTNLVDNALTYGKPPVAISAEVDGDACVLLVRDGGSGIPPSSLARAQEPFVKLHPGHADLGHCGLGLAIVTQICQQLNGHLVQRSYVGGGSALGVRLPKRLHPWATTATPGRAR